MYSDCRPTDADSCDNALYNNATDCAFAISLSDMQCLNSRLADQSKDCDSQLVDCGILPTLELSQCFDGWQSDCETTQCQPEQTPECAIFVEPQPTPECQPHVEPQPTPECQPTVEREPSVEAPPTTEYQPITDFTPDSGDTSPLEGGARVVLGDGAIPEVLQPYASYENGMLVIDAKGSEIPPLIITKDNVVIRNARIKGFDGPTIAIDGANNVIIEGCEITGGQRGVRADGGSNITVKNNWLHDFRWAEKFDSTAVEFNNVSGGAIENNKINGLYKSDAISMFESQNIKASYNNLDITIDEWSSAPLMVEGNSSRGIEVSNNTIKYPVGNNVPPGLLGGTNQRAFNNLVNGNRSVDAWQMYAYNPVWQGIYFDGQLISPN